MTTCPSDVATQIKRQLTATQVAEFYGFHPDRSGFIQCPFHTGDNHGSLKVYSGDKSGWHCFGCGAGGSVIDFVMRLFDISFAQACLRLNMDFNLGLTGERPGKAARSNLLAVRRQEEEKKAEAREAYMRVAREHRYWWETKKYFEPEPDELVIHPLYAEALRRLPLLEYWLDENIGR